jgi:hypothetical protein
LESIKRDRKVVRGGVLGCLHHQSNKSSHSHAKSNESAVVAVALTIPRIILGLVAKDGDRLWEIRSSHITVIDQVGRSTDRGGGLSAFSTSSDGDGERCGLAVAVVSDTVATTSGNDLIRAGLRNGLAVTTTGDIAVAEVVRAELILLAIVIRLAVRSLENKGKASHKEEREDKQCTDTHQRKIGK